MKNVFKGHNALVTGASGGIGLEYCRQLCRMGTNLLMVSNQKEELDKYAAQLSYQSYESSEISGSSGSSRISGPTESSVSTVSKGIRILTLCIDLTSDNCVEEILSYADSHDFNIDILINNAGIFSFNPLLDTNPKKVDAFIDLHMRSMTRLCIGIGQRMRERHFGYILNMSSMSCWMPMPGLAMYSSTKAYIRVLSRSLNYELRDYGVKVMVACPGGIATSLFGLPDNLMKIAVGVGAVQTPEKFVRNALKELAKGKKQYINGWLNRVSIVAVGATPTWMRMMVKHKMLDKNICRP